MNQAGLIFLCVDHEYCQSPNWTLLHTAFPAIFFRRSHPLGTYRSTVPQRSRMDAESREQKHVGSVFPGRLVWSCLLRFGTSALQAYLLRPLLRESPGNLSLDRGPDEDSLRYALEDDADITAVSEPQRHVWRSHSQMTI